MLQKMVRTAFRTNNTDNCARVCHAPTVAGLATTLGVERLFGILSAKHII